MGKYSEFERNERDYYPTPLKAVLPLLPYLKPNTNFIEPCAGDGRLVQHLESYGHKSYYASDIEPQVEWIAEKNAYDFAFAQYTFANCFITNPPWSTKSKDVSTGKQLSSDMQPLHRIIDNLSNQLPTWLLMPADWMHTKQAKVYLDYCVKIVSVGRVKWIEDSSGTGKENCCWYLFDQRKRDCVTEFISRD